MHFTLKDNGVEKMKSMLSKSVNSLRPMFGTFRIKAVLFAFLFIPIISGSAKACTFFDFSPLCQARNAIGATGFNSGLGGLNSYLQQLLTNYEQSGRSYGFYPQNLNSDAYFGSLNFNSSGVFYRFNNPF